MAAATTLIARFWQDQIAAHHRQGVFLVLVAFLASFAFIRTSARLTRSVSWWPGGVVSGGVHLHHLVWGILLMLVSAIASFALVDESLWWQLSAVGFGIGAGLTLDEFALWVYLQDVYWARQGRASLDAVGLATAFMLLVLVGARPFDLGPRSGVLLVAGGALVLAVSCVCFLKERLLLGVLGLFGPGIVLAIVPALRLAKPTSVWARWFYGSRDPARQQAAERRFAPDRRSARLSDRLRDFVGGGLPGSPPTPAARPAASDPTERASEQRARR